MTHEHDFDLITAIAEGSLSPDDEAAAEASLTACGSCRIDLELQREALAALQSAPVLAMTDFERAILHREVAAAIAPPSRTPSRKPAPWFQRLVPAMAAAAALLVVIGVGSVLIGNDAGDFDAASETAPAAGEVLRSEADEETSQAAGGLEADDLADASTTTAAALAPAESVVENLGDISTTALQEAAYRLMSEPDDGAADTGGAPGVMFSTDLLCVETAAAEGDITAVRRATVEGVDIEIYRIADRVDVYSRPDCSLFDSFE
jgi:hypothetical protein